MDDLNALFDSVDGLQEDLVEYGTIAAAAVGANVLWNYGVAWVVGKYGASIPAWARKYGIPAAAVLAGIFGGRYVARWSRKAGMGVTIGLVASGLTGFARLFAPTLPYTVQGLGASPDEMLLGLSEQDLFQKYLAGAPSTVEDVAGLGTTPIAVEESAYGGYGGLGTAPTTVEQVSGLADYDPAPTFTN